MSSTSSQKVALLSAGGTGGHFFPALALADDLLKRGYKVHFVTDARGAKYQQNLEDVTFHTIMAGTVTQSGILGKFKGLMKLGVGVIQGFKLVRKTKPKVVIGFGGYPSVPAVWAAQKLRIATILHEQNATMGKANAFLSSKANRIALSLPVQKGLGENERYRSVITGNPVRPEIVDLYSDPYQLPQEEDNFRIFVMGGSLGATVFANIVPKAIGILPKDIHDKLEIIQQVREADMDEVKEAYQKLGTNVVLQSFFEDMAGQLSNAHLVICRAGASSVAEISVAGRPAIFVPYPHHEDDQQKVNAQSLSRHGGAWMMEEKDFTAEKLATKISELVSDPQQLFDTAEKCRDNAKPDAARKLGNLVVALSQGWDKKETTPKAKPEPEPETLVSETEKAES